MSTTRASRQPFCQCLGPPPKLPALVRLEVRASFLISIDHYFPSDRSLPQTPKSSETMKTCSVGRLIQTSHVPASIPQHRARSSLTDAIVAIVLHHGTPYGYEEVSAVSRQSSPPGEQNIMRGVRESGTLRQLPLQRLTPAHLTFEASTPAASGSEQPCCCILT